MYWSCISWTSWQYFLIRLMKGNIRWPINMMKKKVPNLNLSSSLVHYLQPRPCNNFLKNLSVNSINDCESNAFTPNFNNGRFNGIRIYASSFPFILAICTQTHINFPFLKTIFFAGINLYFLFIYSNYH